MAEDLYEKILHSFPNSLCVGIRKKYEGHTGAPVFAVQYKSKNKYGLNGAFIVKIGSEEWAKEEEALYRSLSNSALAPLLTQPHMPSGVVEGQTAVAYDIAFDSLQTTILLMDVLHDGRGRSEEETQSQIEGLSHALVQWYRDGKLADNNVVEEPHTLLFRMLTERRTNDLLERLKDTLPFWSSDTLQIAIQGSKENSLLPNPLVYMRKETWQKVISLRCPLVRIHGDLHTGNIICPPLSQSLPKIIDFDQCVGEGVPFFDLAYLEFDIMRQLLPLEQEENRKHWLSLLDFCMVEEEGDPKNLPWNVRRTWRFIDPIRQEMRQLQEIDGEYNIVRWLATVAVGLNFARKGGPERSSFERMAGLLYAAYGLACTLKALHVEEEMMEKPSFICWLRGEENGSPSPNLPISPALPGNVPNAFSKDENQTIAIEAPQGIPSALSSKSPFDQYPPVDPVGKFFEETTSLPNAEKGDVVEDLFSLAEDIPKAAEKSSLHIGVENASVEAAETIQSLLQKLLDRFNMRGLIYCKMCEDTNVALLLLEGYLQEVNKKNANMPYKITFLLSNALRLEKDARSALQGFQKICPPLNMGKRDPHYDEIRDSIAHMLEELLAKFLELLRYLKEDV